MGNREFLIFRDTDFENASGSAFLTGSPIYAFGTALAISGTNNVQTGETSSKIAFIDQTIDKGSVGSNFRRLLKTPSAMGVNEVKVTINGDWNINAGSRMVNGSFNSYVLTPNIFLQMVTRKRPMYVLEPNIIGPLIDGDTGLENLGSNNIIYTGSAFKLGSAHFNKYGMVFVPESWTLNSNVGQDKHTVWQISGIMDNGSYNWNI